MLCDLTHGHPLKQLLKFAIPLALASCAQIMYNIGDMAVVGHILGKTALAAIGACAAPIIMLLGFFQGLATGMTVITSQCYGANNMQAVRRSMTACFRITTAVSLAGSLIICLSCNQILRLMNTPEELFPQCRSYMLVIFGGTVTTGWACSTWGLLRSLGDSRTPLIVSVCCAVINIVLDVLFVRVFHWGVAGTALATQLVHLLAAVICAWVIFRHPELRLKRCDWRRSRRFELHHLRVGLPIAFQSALIGVGIVILQRTLNGFGPDIVAGAAAAAKIEMIAIQLMFSIGMALITFAGQNYGAKRYDRIRKGTGQMFLFLGGLAIVDWAIIQLGYPFLSRLFFGQAAEPLMDTIRTYLRIAPSFHLILVVLAVYRNTLQGMGCSKLVLMASLLELCARSAGAPILGHYFGYAGACFADPLAWIVSDALVLPYYFHKMRQLERRQAALQDGRAVAEERA